MPVCFCSFEKENIITFENFLKYQHVYLYHNICILKLLQKQRVGIFIYGFENQEYLTTIGAINIMNLLSNKAMLHYIIEKKSLTFFFPFLKFLNNLLLTYPLMDNIIYDTIFGIIYRMIKIFDKIDIEKIIQSFASLNPYFLAYLINPYLTKYNNNQFNKKKQKKLKIISNDLITKQDYDMPFAIINTPLPAINYFINKYKQYTISILLTNHITNKWCMLFINQKKKTNRKILKKFTKKKKKKIKKSLKEMTKKHYFKYKKLLPKICEYKQNPNRKNDICISNKKMKLCSVCKFVAYCSRNCQKKDWTKHKQFCHNIMS